MVRTRVGYAGGTTDSPTYHELGDHTETLELDYDPHRIRLEELLEVFWAEHNPCRRPWSRQYMSALFYHDATQHDAFRRALQSEAGRRRSAIHTRVLPCERFYLAEDYHQKYFLQKDPQLCAELQRQCGGFWPMVDSTAAARLNALLGGETLEESPDDLGLSGRWLEHVGRRLFKAG